jgi:predicted transcriptional regulator
MAGSLTVELDEELLQSLDRLTEKTRRSREWHIGQAVRDYVALNAWQVERIEVGIAAADQDDFASDEEVTRISVKFGG